MYKNEDEIELARNHRHFILVDDGSNGESKIENNFRISLELELARSRKSSSVSPGNIPMVLIVIQGDLFTLKKIQTFVENKIPVLLIAVSLSESKL